jgi:hypothetical protein
MPLKNNTINVHDIMSKIKKVNAFAISADEQGDLEMLNFIKGHQDKIDKLTIEIKRLYSVMSTSGNIPDTKYFNDLVTKLGAELSDVHSGILIRIKQKDLQPVSQTEENF